MNVQILGIVAILSVTASGCGDSDEKKVGGRRRSLATVASATTTGSARLRLRRTRDVATGEVSFEALLDADGPLAEDRVLQLPSGEELDLKGDGSNRVLSALNAEPVAGAYTLLWEDPIGTLRTRSFVVGQEFPPHVTIERPLDQALFNPELEDLRWTWPGSSPYFDVEVYSGSGELLLLRESAQVTALRLGAVKALGRARLVVGAASGPTSASVRLESRSQLFVDLVSESK